MMEVKWMGACLVAVVLVMAGSAVAGLTYYTDGTTFASAFPGLTVEDFDDGTGATGTMYGPLNSLSDNGKFAPGDIVEGLEFTVSANGLYLSTYGGSKALGCQQLAPGVTLRIALTGGDVTAFCMDIVDDTGYAPNPAVTLYDPAGAELGSWSSSVPAGGSIFFGVACDSGAIGRVDIWSGPSPTVDNVGFVPEPATLALLVLGGAALLRRRH